MDRLNAGETLNQLPRDVARQCPEGDGMESMNHRIVIGGKMRVAPQGQPIRPVKQRV